MQAETVQTFDGTTRRIYPIQFVQEGPLHDVPVPLVRVSTCGGLQLEVLQEVISTDPPHGRYQVVTLEQRPKGSTGLTLLKILASLPEHYAAKDWLTEYLPRTRCSNEEVEEEEWGRGLVRVDSVVSLLRSLLCPSGMVEEAVARRLLVAHVVSQFCPQTWIWLTFDTASEPSKKRRQCQTRNAPTMFALGRHFRLLKLSSRLILLSVNCREKRELDRSSIKSASDCSLCLLVGGRLKGFANGIKSETEPNSPI